MTLDEMIRNHVTDVMRLHKGDKDKAAKHLQVSKRTIYRYIKAWGDKFWEKAA